MDLEQRALIQEGKRAITHAMQKARAMPVDSCPVGGCPVSLVASEAILGEMPVITLHDAVSKNFGQDAGCGDGGAGAVTLDDGLTGDWNIRGLGSIDQNQIRNRSQLRQRSRHGLKGGLKNIDLIDNRGRNSTSAPGQGACQNFLTEQLTSLMR